MNNQARTFNEDHLQRKAQALQLAYTRALNSHDGTTPLYLHQEMDFLGHFEPDTRVSLCMVPQVLSQDPIAGLLLMTSQLEPAQANVLVKAAETGALTSALLNQLFGPGNLLGNIANVIEATVKARFTAQMKAELLKVLASGQSRLVKLGNGVELKVVGYKGVNQLGKHADALLRIRQPNAKVITLMEKAQFEAVSKNMHVKSLGADAFNTNKVLSLSRQASDDLWQLRRLTGSPWLSSAKVGGALAFGPTLINDIVNNYNHHARLDQRFNFRQFAVDSVKNQTGNLLGAGASAVTVAVLTGTTIAGAPVVLLSLAIGIAVCWTYDTQGIGSLVEQKANALFK
ncbi:MAG: hypothetical protein ACK4FF_09230 [Limnobacter sp.]|uniref:hypothetical protein n=1 Tax=Limnobacter sp. TaxID=2003368 RepID=UPI003918D508